MAKDQTQNRLNEFIKLLAADRDEAAGRYVALYERLSRFFDWRGCENANELADRVFDRIDKKIEEGEKIENAEAYAIGIAKFVLLEHRRLNAKTDQLDENSQNLKSVPKESDLGGEEMRSARQSCLNQCLNNFAKVDCDLIVSYFDTEETTLIPKRRRLAEELGVSLNTLRIRICRFKSKLEKCVRKCCEA